jgi:exonuclease SbcC
MIVEKIHLENWKKFRDPLDVEFSNELNIIYGSNEKGKTTLMDSIRTVFFNKHTSKSTKVKSLVPWDSKLYPLAEIEFEHKNDKYRIKKRFIDSESILEKLGDGVWHKIADGDAADNEIINMIGGSLPRGAKFESKNWGIGQSLWMVQGNPIISDDLNEDTLNSLQKLIGTSIESKNERNIINKINSRFLAEFTKKQKKFTSNSQIVSLREDIKNLENTLEEINNSKFNKEKLMREIEDKSILLKKEKGKLEIAYNEKSSLEEDVKLAQERKYTREKLVEELEKMDAIYRSLNEKINDFKVSKQKINDYKQENEDLSSHLEGLNKKHGEKEKKINSMMNTLKEMENLSNEFTDKKRIMSITHTNIMQEAQLRDKKVRFEEIDQIFKKLKQKKEKLDSFQAPTEDELLKIEKIQKEIHDTKTRLDAIGLDINIFPNSPISGNINLDGKKRAFELTDSPISWNAHQSVLLNINDIGNIEIKSGSKDVKQMKESLEGLNKKMEELIKIYPKNEINDLRELFIQKKNLKNEVTRLEKEYNSKESRETITNEINGLKNKIISDWKKIPEDSPFRDCNKIDKQTAIEKLSKMLIEMDETQNQLKIKKERLNTDIQIQTEENESINKQIQELNKQIYGNLQIITEIKEALSKYDENFSLSEQENKLNQLSVTIDQEKRALQVYKSEIEEKENKPINSYQSAENKVYTLNDIVNQYKLSLAKLKGELKQIINKNSDSSKIEEKLDYLKKKEEELETENKAIALLYEITQFYRENTIVELSQPIQNQMNRYIEHLLGTKYPSINLSNMKPSSVEVIGNKEMAELEDLSFGTQEQIWCLFRLALGKFLSKENRQLVVLDDPLVNTDYPRLERMLDILKECANDLQIIILTCDVDKYNRLKANFIPLEAKLGIKREKVDLEIVP